MHDLSARNNFSAYSCQVAASLSCRLLPSVHLTMRHIWHFISIQIICIIWFNTDRAYPACDHSVVESAFIGALNCYWVVHSKLINKRRIYLLGSSVRVFFVRERFWLTNFGTHSCLIVLSYVSWLDLVLFSILSRSWINIWFTDHELWSRGVLWWDAKSVSIVVDTGHRWLLWLENNLTWLSLIQGIIREKLMLFDRLSGRFFDWVRICFWRIYLFWTGFKIFELKLSFSKRGVDTLEKSWFHFHFMNLVVIAHVM